MGSRFSSVIPGWCEATKLSSILRRAPDPDLEIPDSMLRIAPE
jgi:hypothetical protein